MKNKIKNSKGITLVALIITIVIMIILASIGTYSGIEVIKSSKFTRFQTELKIMQSKTNEWYDEYKDDENNSRIISELGATATLPNDANASFLGAGKTNDGNYLYFSEDTIENLDLKEISYEFLINIKKREVISYKGFEYQGTKYYTLEQIPDSLYNVEHENRNTWNSETDSFDVNYTELGENKYRIDVSNIDYKSGNINKWQVKYKKEEESDWRQVDNYSFIINEAGNYKVKIANNNVESNEKQLVIISSLLPSEFQKTEYIENTGTQYIDTGFIPNYTKNIDIEIVSTPSVSNSRYCLLSNYSESLHLSLELINNKGRCFYNAQTIDSSIGTMSTSMKNTYLFRYDAINKKYNLTFNNETISGDMNATGISGNSMLAFVDQQKRFSTFSNSIKLYSLKISEGGTLIRNFVPCYSTTTVTDVNDIQYPSDTIGLYDTVEGKFYTNQGTGKFYMQSKSKKYSLPSEYQQVEYIENTGTQYIDTGFTPNYTKNIDIEILSTPSALNSRYCLLSNYSESRHLSLELYGNRGRCYYNTGNVDSSIGTMSTSMKNVYLFNYNAINKKYSLTFNNETIVGDMNATGISSNSMLAFVDQQKRFSIFSNSIKLYSLKISEGGILIKNFIPCYSTTTVTDVNDIQYSSDTIGLYDTVEGKFYVNHGSGTFLKGNDVSGD